ncbi:MAG: FemAB family XrtA/PEP-CTERM system-associated protein, partial [Pseudomonadota bacterium]
MAEQIDIVAVSSSEVGSSTHQEWDAFVTNCPGGTILHRAGWSTLLRQTPGFEPVFLSARREGRIVGVLPLAKVHRFPTGSALLSTPFCVYGGALSMDEAVAERLEDAATETAKDLKVDYLELRNVGRKRVGWELHGAFQTFIKTLPEAADEVLGTIPRKQRAEVRGARKKGIEVAQSADFDGFYDRYARSMRDHGSPVFAKSVLYQIIKLFPDETVLHEARYKDSVIAAVLSFWDGSTVRPYYAASVPEAHRIGAFPAIYAAIMEDAVERGCTQFDFGRSTVNTGSAKFKQNMGFTPTDLTYQVVPIGKHTVEAVSPDNPKFR